MAREEPKGTLWEIGAEVAGRQCSRNTPTPGYPPLVVE